MNLKNHHLNTRQQTAITFIVLIILHVLVYIALNTLETEEVLYEYMAENLGHDMAIEQINQLQRTEFILLKYLLHILWIPLKLAGIAIIFMLGLFAYNIKITFSQVFQGLLYPAFIFLIPDVLKIAWFSLVQTNYEMNDLNKFPRFSLFELLIALDFVINEDFQTLLKLLLQPFTVIHFLFCWLVAGQLTEIKPDDKKILRAVLVSFFSVLTVFNFILYGMITLFVS